MPRARTFTFHANAVLAGQEIRLAVKYTDVLGGKSTFPFFIDVDPLTEIEIDLDQKDSSDKPD
jgi:hypothetical protein